MHSIGVPRQGAYEGVLAGLVCGWAGELDPYELRYVLAHLSKDGVLSRAWGFRPSTKRRTTELVTFLALHGDPESERTNRAIVRAWWRGERRFNVLQGISGPASASPTAPAWVADSRLAYSQRDEL